MELIGIQLHIQAKKKFIAKYGINIQGCIGYHNPIICF